MAVQKSIVGLLLPVYIARMDQLRQEQFMDMALHEASFAFDSGEIPVGALVIFEDRVIGRGHNRTRQLHDASAHAEMIALTAAYNHFGDWRLENCILVSTLEPCPMCAGAAMLSRIKTIVYGAPDPKFGACGSIIDIPSEKRFNHRIEVIADVRQDEVTALMKSFFKKLRDGKERVN